MAQDASASTGTNHVPVQRAGEGGLPGTPAPERAHPERAPGPTRPVPLDRLLTVAVLTPAQAVYVAARLLSLREDTGREGAAGRALVTVDGDLRLDPAHAAAGRRQPPDSELLERLVASARRLPAHPRPHQVLLLRRLEEAVGADEQPAGARAAGLQEALVQALGQDAPARIGHELAALVEAFAHVAPGVPAGNVLAGGEQVPLLADGAASPVRPRRDPVTTVPHGRARGAVLGHRRSARGRRPALVLLVVAVVLVGGGYLVLRGPGAGLIESLGGGNHATPAQTPTHQNSKQQAQQKTAQGPAHRRAVPALAARHAGAVTGVVVQKTGSCRPGSLCPVKVTVHFKPTTTTRTISWKVGAARLCKRGIAWSPPTGVTAQPGWSTVYASSSVRVPKGRSLALVALTTSPARAQSRAVPVTGSTLHC